MSENALYLSHRCWTYAGGNVNQIQESLDLCAKVDGLIANIYSKVTGKTTEECIIQMDKNNGNGEWMTSDEAKIFGFITNTFIPKKMAALADNKIMAQVKLPIIPEAKLTQITNIKIENNMKFKLLATAAYNAVIAFLGFNVAEGATETTEDFTPEHLIKVNAHLIDLQAKLTAAEATLAAETAAKALAVADAAAQKLAKETAETNLTAMTADRDDWKQKVADGPGAGATKKAPSGEGAEQPKWMQSEFYKNLAKNPLLAKETVN